ncbi:uncharacterized protein LOC124161192 isoform X3 [Ischnura elegans]|uniref:uncharacterized protein LOC124161192 isoform X3 n=1 Tax=Ischnura elegans TaxID=197161 RepID=UPI001ED871D6|nr:uncharacterized protein LOC124161192 isoform X3 [Ischnura elegans]
MNQEKENSKNLVKSEDKSGEQNPDFGRGMRNSIEKSNSEILDEGDRSKQSKQEKTSAKPQATRDTATTAPTLEGKPQSDTSQEGSATCSTENEKKRDSLGKFDDHLIPGRVSKRSRKLDRTSSGSKEGRDSSSNGLAARSPSAKSQLPSTAYGVDLARHLRNKVDFTPGARLEARDFTERWYAAKVVEVDWEEEEVLVHFEKWSSRFDEWISMDSPRLRPPTLPTNRSKVQYREGEKVMAYWLDRQKYPAKVLKVLPNDNYEIMFYDGYTKTVSGKRMAKATEKEIEKAKKEMPLPTMPGQAGVIPPPPPTSIFTDTDIGTKEDRRRRKKKLDVAGLFAKGFRQSASKKEAEEVKKAEEESLKEKEEPVESQAVDKSDSKATDSQNDDESPEEGRLVYDSEDEVEERVYSPPPVEPSAESSSPPRGKGMRTKFKPPSKDIPETESTRKRKIQVLDDSSTDFLRLRFKSRKSTPVAKKRPELPPEKEAEVNVSPQEPPMQYNRKQIKEPIHVPDKKLPAGWRKFAIKRKIGASAGKWDIYMQSPDGHKIRSPHALRSFFAKRGVDNINLDRFDFAPSKAVFPRDGGRPALALSPEEINAALEEEKTPSKPSSPGPPMRLSAGGPKVLLPKGHSPVSPVAKRLKTLMPRARTSTGESSGEPLPQLDAISPAETPESGAWKETNCKMDSTYICPKEGCGKNFRKENLLQMHIKHYHPEYCKLVGSAPNVADLASARMDGGESLFDFRPARVSRTPPVEPSPRGGRGRGRWMGLKRGGGTPRPAESIPASPPKLKSAETPGVHESDAKWDLPTSSPTIKTLLPVRPAEPQDEGSTVDAPPPTEIESVMEDGVQLMQEVISETPIISSPLSRRRLMGGVGKRKRRLTFLPSHMAKRRKFVADGKVPVVQLQKLKVTTDSQGRVILSEPHRNTSQGLPQKGIKAEYPLPEREIKTPRERTTVSGLSVSSMGSGIRRRRKRKSELLSREEIVNCICGSPEEDGLMMQCELCLCWQHGHCNNIEREIEVPEKYVCYICLNPQKERKSMKYFHDQDWLKKGVLPSLSFRGKEDESKVLQRFRVLKKSHELTGSLLQLKTVVHSLRVKVNMIGKNDHPKLYLWSKSWEASSTTNDAPEMCGLSLKEESDKMGPPPPVGSQANSTYGDITKTEDNLPELTMEQGVLDEKDKGIPSLECQVGISAEDGIHKNEGIMLARERDDSSSGFDCLTEERKADGTDIPLDTSATLSAASEDLKQEQHEEELAMSEMSLSGHTPKIDLLQGHAVGDDDCPPVLELPLSQSELQQLASTVEDKLRASEVRAPQPEAPIDPMECQLTLLDHIESMQQEVDSRLTLIEAQVAALEAEDEDIASDEPPEFYPHTKQTIQMIMRDLNTARRIASFCGKS